MVPDIERKWIAEEWSHGPPKAPWLLLLLILLILAIAAALWWGLR